jgi:hypothetical protein
VACGQSECGFPQEHLVTLVTLFLLRWQEISLPEEAESRLAACNWLPQNYLELQASNAASRAQGRETIFHGLNPII